METFLISSPTRCGGQYLEALLRSTTLIPKDTPDAPASLIKTNDPLYELDYSNTCLILLSRRDKAAAILSSLISIRSGQWAEYKTVPEPFLVNCDPIPPVWSDVVTSSPRPPSESETSRVGLYLNYKFNRYHEQSHDFSRPYAKIQRFCFEDFFGNHDHVFSTLGLSPALEITLPPPCPYSYRDIIINYEDCIQTIQQWDQYEDHHYNLINIV